jgi:CheY-like chemotaxis protein
MVVLVVEDEWLLRACVCVHLRAPGLRVLEARTGEAALSLLAGGERVDVLFTDIELASAMNGWDVAGRFRRLLPEMPVVYASGRASQPERGVPDSLFVAKPYEPDAIVEALSRLEHAPDEGGTHAPPRYHKISHDGAAIERAFVDRGALGAEAAARPIANHRGTRTSVRGVQPTL